MKASRPRPNRPLFQVVFPLCVLLLAAISAAAQTFSNPAPIAIPDSGTATPYPSAITVSGVAGSIVSVRIALNNFSHTFSDDVGVVLVGPTGAALLVQDGAGDGSDPIVNVTYTLADSGATLLPDDGTWGDGTYQPADYYGGDTFPSPGPGTTYNEPGPDGTSTFASTFGGTNANGTWNLYVVDFIDGDSGAFAGGWSLTIVAGSGAPVPSSAVSRKTHGGAGVFDINLPLVPLAGAVGIEDRTGAVGGEHQEVITFAAPVTVGGAMVTAGTGSVGGFTVNGAVVTVNLTGVTNAQRLGVTLMNVNDGTNAGNVVVPMGVLSGDTNASSGVSAADVSQTKAQSGNATTAANFRQDVNANGSISAADVALVKSRSGTALPP